MFPTGRTNRATDSVQGGADMSPTGTKVRALCLMTITVLSVVVTGVTFTGGVAAAGNVGSAAGNVALLAFRRRD